LDVVSPAALSVFAPALAFLCFFALALCAPLWAFFSVFVVEESVEVELAVLPCVLDALSCVLVAV
jgi:hypothetical protein